MADAKCGKCGHANLPGTKYCSRCTALLDLTCLDCGHTNPHGSKFCSQCASALPEHAEQPKTGARRWLVVAAWVVPLLAVNVLFFRSVFGTGSVEGEIRSRGQPHGDYALEAAACFSGDRENFFGAWITPELVDKGKKYGAKGGLKLVKNPLGEWDVYVESPLECEGFKCKTRPLEAAHCTRFEVEVHDTGTEVNDVVEREGRAALDCRFPGGGTLTANLRFDECH